MTVKEQLHKLVDELPDDDAVEEMQYRLYVLRQLPARPRFDRQRARHRTPARRRADYRTSVDAIHIAAIVHGTRPQSRTTGTIGLMTVL